MASHLTRLAQLSRIDRLRGIAVRQDFLGMELITPIEEVNQTVQGDDKSLQSAKGASENTLDQKLTEK